MPIAEVASDTAGRAALEEVAREMTAAETEGRVIKKVPLKKIIGFHLCRDRMVVDPDDMAALQAELGVPVVAVNGRGSQLRDDLARLAAAAQAALNDPQSAIAVTKGPCAAAASAAELCHARRPTASETRQHPGSAGSPVAG